MSSLVSTDITKISHRFAVRWSIPVRELADLASSSKITSIISSRYKFKNIENLEFAYHLFYREYFQMRVDCKTDMPMFQEDALVLIKGCIYRLQCTPTKILGRLAFNRDVLTESSFEDDKVTIHCIMSIPAQVKAVIHSHSSFKEDKYVPNVVECESIVAFLDIDPYGYDAINEFEYSSRVPDFNVKMAVSMVGEADKRHKPLLKALCLEYLMENLTTENVSEVLKLAAYFDATDLTRKCVDFLFTKCKIIPID